jgi:hypothetical protein
MQEGECLCLFQNRPIYFRGGSQSIFLTVGSLLTTNGEGIGIAVAGTHFVGLNKSIREALMKSLLTIKRSQSSHVLYDLMRA